MTKQISKIRKKQILAGIISAVLLILLDQFTKYLAVKNLKGASSIQILPGVFELSYLENHGAAFGILQGQRSFLIILTVVVLILVGYLYFHISENKRYFCIRIITVLLISGAIGNFIDRCVYQYVIDFFYFKLINFPVFNVADIYVVMAAVLLIISFCFYYKEEDIDMLISDLLPFIKKKEKHS